MAPTYTMLFGGSAEENGELGKNVMRVPAKKVIDTILKIVEIYREERTGNESLDAWITGIVKGQGNKKVRNLDDIKLALSSVTNLPSITEDPESYRDYGNDVKFTAKTAKGECAA
jgi:sulfite reductase (ferredoxin)